MKPDFLYISNGPMKSRNTFMNVLFGYASTNSKPSSAASLQTRYNNWIAIPFLFMLGAIVKQKIDLTLISGAGFFVSTESQPTNTI